MSDSAPPRPSPHDPSPTGTRGLKIAIAAGILLLGAGLWLVTFVARWGSRTPAQAPETAARASSARRIQATLFYVTEDGTALAPLVREVPFGESTADQAK